MRLVVPTILGILTKTLSGDGDMVIHKAMLFYLLWRLTCAYVTVGLAIVVWPRYIAKKHINAHRVVHYYGLCMMVKAAQPGCANVVSKLVACHQPQRELVQCHKMCFRTNSFCTIVARCEVTRESAQVVLTLFSWNILDFFTFPLARHLADISCPIGTRNRLVIFQFQHQKG